MSKEYREGLPEMPERIAKLPVERGYPVPWFVAEVDGHYDFRVIDARKFGPAIKDRLCWICGEVLGTTLAFSIGPMCVITRTISEPPSHRECAEWSIKACPFLTQQQTRRNEADLPEGVEDPAGIAIKRQPGAVCLWLTKKYLPFEADGGLLFRIGDPEQVFWYREGRTATRAEVWESIETGLPLLIESAVDEAKATLRADVDRIMPLLPAEEGAKKALPFGVAARRSD